MARAQYSEFKIYGKITGVNVDSVFMFTESDYKNMHKCLAIVKNNRFYFSGHDSLPVLKRFFINGIIPVNIYIDSKKTEINWDIKEISYDSSNKARSYFSNSCVSYGSMMDKDKMTIENKLAEIEKQQLPLQQTNELYYSTLNKFIIEHKSSKVSAYVLGNATYLDISQILKLYHELDLSLHGTFEEYTIKELVRNLHYKATGSRLKVKEAWVLYNGN